jgi:D-amino-acid oxidase
MASVCIVGAGVIGLSTALRALEEGGRVTVYAEQFGLDTTSSGAGALWRPVFVPGPEEQTNKWAFQTFNHLSNLIANGEADAAGLRWCDGTELFGTMQEERPGWSQCLPAFR